MDTVRTYTKKEASLYLTGMFGQNMIYNIVATGLYFYFQNVICLPAMALGWIMAIARIWDAMLIRREASGENADLILSFRRRLFVLLHVLHF